MQNEWATFLEQQSNTVTGLDGQRAALEGDILCGLGTMGIIKVTGGDATTFLQGQFSNDVNAVSDTISQLSSYNSPKGRMFAAFRLFKFGDGYLLLMPREIIEPTQKRLQMFVMRSDVQLADVSDEMVVMGLSGSNVSSAMSGLFNAVPSEVNNVAAWEKGLIVKVPGTSDRFQVLCPLADAQAYWASLSAKCTVVGEEAWKLLDIHAGIPQVYMATREEFVPQMVNLHSIGGVSFKKGCYPGQEIVARMHYLGKLKKRMYRVHVDSDTAPAINADIFEAGGENTQSVGQIVDVAADPNGGFQALVVLQIKSAIESPLNANASGNLEIEELPYEVSNEA